MRAMSAAIVTGVCLSLAGPALSQHDYDAEERERLDWQEEERGILTDQVQLTYDDQFTKAGEAYFDPTMNWVIFQAVPVPPEGEEPDPHYSMYVAKLVKDADGTIVAIEEPIRLSEPGSANTCGFFHPDKPWKVIFGSTMAPPSFEKEPGYKRDSSRYVWQFPKEMEITTTTVRPIWDDMHKGEWSSDDRPAPTPPAEPVLERPDGYDAECAYSPDGRFIVFGSMVDAESKDLDLFVHDTQTGETTKIVEAPGYDGGPFFSPDGTRICYRSDREGNDLLQLFVADLAFDDDGSITGIEKEHQLTDNRHVNWGPYWHPSGEYLVYATSEIGHHNYEVFSIEVPERGASVERADLAKTRVTHASGFDGLPVFSDNGEYLIWTSQRTHSEADGYKGSSQVWVARVKDASPE